MDSCERAPATGVRTCVPARLCVCVCVCFMFVLVFALSALCVCVSQCFMLFASVRAAVHASVRVLLVRAIALASSAHASVRGWLSGRAGVWFDNSDFNSGCVGVWVWGTVGVWVCGCVVCKCEYKCGQGG